MKLSIITLAAALLGVSAAYTQAQAEDLAAGEASFRKCLSCHAIGPEAKNKVGPELNGLDGRKSGSVEGYSYSAANKDSGIIWSETEFKAYIRDPKLKIPKTKMAFAGIKKSSEIDNLWAYLAQFKADGSKK